MRIVQLILDFLGIKLQKSIKNQNSFPLLTQILSSTKWSVSYYHDNYNDQSVKLNHYSLTFGANGTFTASGKDFETKGKWYVNDNLNKLIIYVNTKEPISELSDEWVIEECSISNLKLGDDKFDSNEKLHLVSKK